MALRHHMLFQMALRHHMLFQMALRHHMLFQMTSHSHILLIIGMLLLSKCTAQEQTKPNIVVIMADDLGYNDVSYHGSEISTPNIDQLAVSGVRLENYYTSPQCGPSRAQFFSGRYNIHLGTQHTNFSPCRPNGLPLEYPTMADEMRSLNYSTHMIGKWHLGHHTEEFLPTNRGFDTFRGFLLGSGDHYKHSKKYNEREGTDFYEGTTPFNNSYGLYSTHVFTRRAENIIRFYSKDTDTPMFIWLSYQAVHSPTQVPESYEKEYEFIPDRKRRSLAGMVAALDEGVGKVVQALKDAGVYENTIIVFSTDNGGQASSGSSNYPLRGNKNTLFEAGVRGVGFISGPMIALSGAVNDNLVHITDWMPTLLHLAGGNISRLEIDGMNQWQSISTGSAGPRKEILLNIDEMKLSSHDASQSTVFDTRIQAGIIWEEWKLLTGNPGYHLWVPSPQSDYSLYSSYGNLITNRGAELNGTVFLYNLKLDQSESFNMVQLRPDIALNLLSKLAEYKNSSIPAYNPPMTMRCNPHFNGGFWGPYLARGNGDKLENLPTARNRAHEPLIVKPPDRRITNILLNEEENTPDSKKRFGSRRNNNRLLLQNERDTM